MPSSFRSDVYEALRCVMSKYTYAVLQVVEPNDLMDAVQRTKYGVNGGKNSILPASWQKKLNEVIVNSFSANKGVRTVPTQF